VAATVTGGPIRSGATSDDRLRIVFVAWKDLAHPEAGGSEVLVDRLATGLQARGHEVALVCGGPVGRRPYEVVEAGGTYSQYLAAPLATRRFRDWDVVVDVVNGFPYFSPLWRRSGRLCMFNHVHGNQWFLHFPRPVATVGAAVERQLVPLLYRTTRFVTISDSTKRELVELGLGAEHIRVLDLGVNEDLMAPPVPESDEPLFVVMSRLAPNKRVDRILDAWAQIHPQVGGRLAIVGKGPLQGDLERRATDGVEFLGYIDEEAKRRLLGEAWLLVHAARNEGWGMVVMEAAAQETPTLAIETGGIRDSAVDGETAVLVPDADDLAGAWLALATDHDRRHALGARARKRALEFTWDRTVDQLVEAAALASTRSTDRATPARRVGGLRRSARLVDLYRKEPTQPAPFYTFLADDTVDQLEGQGAKLDGFVVDVGGGPGYLAEAVRARGARCLVVEYDFDELHLHGRSPERAVVADGQRLPLRDGIADIVHSSNVLEHVTRPWDLTSEMVRILRPGGIGYMSFTPWYSPWGGHETSPWHFAGGEHAARRFAKKTGAEAKNRFNRNLFELHLPEVRSWFHDNDEIEVLWDGPRYWPPSWRSMVRVPLIGEILTWNYLAIFRRR
jgi:glycosyltransferase involved in cell wall biosynthesis/SAM-dependent methyltransferase